MAYKPVADAFAQPADDRPYGLRRQRWGCELKLLRFAYEALPPHFEIVTVAATPASLADGFWYADQPQPPLSYFYRGPVEPRADARVAAIALARSSEPLSASAATIERAYAGAEPAWSRWRFLPDGLERLDHPGAATLRHVPFPIVAAATGEQIRRSFDALSRLSASQDAVTRQRGPLLATTTTILGDVSGYLGAVPCRVYAPTTAPPAAWPPHGLHLWTFLDEAKKVVACVPAEVRCWAQKTLQLNLPGAGLEIRALDLFAAARWVAASPHIVAPADARPPETPQAARVTSLHAPERYGDPFVLHVKMD